jgi:peptide/nickel transport system substrate-binding protein
VGVTDKRQEFGPDGFIKKFKYPSHSYSYIGYNLRNPLFQDRKVRLALTHLVNRDRILKDVYYGLARIITGPFFSESKSYDKSIASYPFSVETAAKLLADAGWKDVDGDGILEKDGKKFEFTILQVANHPIQKKMLRL